MRAKRTQRKWRRAQRVVARAFKWFPPHRVVGVGCEHDVVGVWQ